MEEILQRQVNYSIFSKQEFLQQLKNKNHFLRSLLAGENMFVIGRSHEFEIFAGEIRAIMIQPV